MCMCNVGSCHSNVAVPMHYSSETCIERGKFLFSVLAYHFEQLCYRMATVLKRLSPAPPGLVAAPDPGLHPASPGLVVAVAPARTPLSPAIRRLWHWARARGRPSRRSRSRPRPWRRPRCTWDGFLGAPRPWPPPAPSQMWRRGKERGQRRQSTGS